MPYYSISLQTFGDLTIKKNNIMRIPRKKKKKIIKTLGRGTYKGILLGYLKIEKYCKNYGIYVEYTGKPMGNKFGETWFHDGQMTPNVTIKLRNL